MAAIDVASNRIAVARAAIDEYLYTCERRCIRISRFDVAKLVDELEAAHLAYSLAYSLSILGYD